MTVRTLQQNVDPLNVAAVVNRPLGDALTGSGYANNGSDFTGFARGLSGNGSPRSANAGAGLAAPVGHLYHQLDATDGRGHWLKVGAGARQWQRIKDQVNAAAFVDVVDGATDNTADLALADNAAAALGVPLFLNPLGTYYIASTSTFASRLVIPKGAKLKRGASATVTFNGGFEAGLYPVLDNTARGTGRFWCTSGAFDSHWIIWWDVVGAAGYGRDEAAQWQDCEDQTPDGAEIRFIPGMQIGVGNRVRFCSVAKFWNAPPAFTDPERGAVMVKWLGDDNGFPWSWDRASLNTVRGIQLRQMNAETIMNFEMSTVSYSASVDIITATGDGYNGVQLPAPCTFSPNDVGKQIFIEASGVAAGIGTHTIVAYIANPANGVEGSQVQISPAPVGTFTFKKFSLGSATFGTGIGINSQNVFQDCTFNQWDCRDSIDVQAVLIARVSNSNNELHRFEGCSFLGIDRVVQYGYQKYNAPACTGAMTVGSNTVTLAAIPPQGMMPLPSWVGKQFRMGRVGTIADATVTVATAAAAGDTVLHVNALTQQIPFDAIFTIHSTVSGADTGVRTRADAPVGATTITVSALATGFNVGDNGPDGGRVRAHNDGSYGQGVGSITGVFAFSVTANAAQNATTIAVSALSYAIASGTTLTFASGKKATLTATANAGATSLTVSALPQSITSGDTAADPQHFTVNFNAPQSVSGLQWLLDRNKARGAIIGPSFNVHHIVFDRCSFSGLYRGIVCFGGGIQVKGLININGCDANFEIGGNNAHPMNLGYINSENSRQHLITSSLVTLEWQGRMSGESTSPGKGFVQVGTNAGQKGLDYSNGVCGGFETYAVTGGTTVWDIRNGGGASIMSKNIGATGYDNNPLSAQQVGLDAESGSYVRAENAYGFNFKVWGLPFTATPQLRFGGLPIFSLYQDSNPRSDLALADFAFRRGGDSSIYVDSYMNSSLGIVTATIRPRRHVVATRGYAPDASDTLVLCAATQFNDSYVTLNGNGNLPTDWECSFKRTDAWAQPFHIFVNTGCTMNGVVENGTGNAGVLLNPGDKVRVACTATGVFETIA